MPPRKRARVSQASTPQPKQSTETTSPSAQPERPNPLHDPWTDDEEIQLFKSLIRCKPTGIHKHFRMLQIQLDLASHGFTAPHLAHTQAPGIWAKLDSLYDLEILDERENAHMGIVRDDGDAGSDEEMPDEDAEDADEDDDNDEDPWRRRDFDLPEEGEYRELAFAKRLGEAGDREESPEAVEGLSRTRNDVLSEEELREKREEYDKEEGRGRGKKTAAARATRRGARSTRSTPAEGTEEEGEEEGGTPAGEDGSPQGKGGKKGVGRGASTRRSRRR